MKLKYFRLGGASGSAMAERGPSRPPPDVRTGRRFDRAGSRRAGRNLRLRPSKKPEGDPRRDSTTPHVKPDRVISGAREIAFFPPMTGGFIKRFRAKWETGFA